MSNTTSFLVMIFVCLLLGFASCVSAKRHEEAPQINKAPEVKIMPEITWHEPKPDVVMVMERVPVLVLDNAVVINVSTSTWNALVEIYQGSVITQSLEFIRNK